MFLAAVAAFLAFLAVNAVCACLNVIGEGQAAVVERLGRFDRVVGPGLHFLWFPVERLKTFEWTRTAERGDGMGRKRVEKETYRNNRLPTYSTSFDFAPQRVHCSDKVEVVVNGGLFYTIVDARRAAYRTPDLWSLVEQNLVSCLKEVCGAMSSECIYNASPEIRNSLKKKLALALGDECGVRIDSVTLESTNPNASIGEAFAEQQRKRMAFESERIRTTEEQRIKEMAIACERSLREKELADERELSEKRHVVAMERLAREAELEAAQRRRQHEAALEELNRRREISRTTEEIEAEQARAQTQRERERRLVEIELDARAQSLFLDSFGEGVERGRVLEYLAEVHRHNALAAAKGVYVIPHEGAAGAKFRFYNPDPVLPTAPRDPTLEGRVASSTCG